jgi:hypothetical protein
MSTIFKFEGWVRSSIGPSVPGAQVFICFQPANAPTSLTRQMPTPSPLVNVFSDVNGLVPITQPIITDGFGFYAAYVAAGSYTILVYLNGILQKLYPDEVPMGSTVFPPLVLQTNGLPNTQQNLLNLFSSDGTVTLTPDLNGNVNLQANGTAISRTAAVQYVIDGSGSAPSVGAKGQITLPTGFNITGVYLTSDVAGSCVLDIKTCTNAGFPGSLTSITASAKPTLSSAQFYSDTTLTGWTKAIAALNQLQFVVNSASTLTRINITLTGTVSG